ncbi:hypothetical protein KIN20_008970 [Parelaphostrongylus tenuis]|uniref:Uncharacterized protein n=1 Tax=Parelaphostrongylus tenuis TaxID=148309 RepID=A0AAD5MNG8_PARTN|nr:hypothetical protein KIN20_008970 [Parelaphostrongylus tenuis]
MATTRGSPGKAYLEIPGNKTAKPARLSCAGARTTSEGGAVQKKKEKEKKKKRKKDYNVTLSSTRVRRRPRNNTRSKERMLRSVENAVGYSRSTERIVRFVDDQ